MCIRDSTIRVRVDVRAVGPQFRRQTGSCLLYTSGLGNVAGDQLKAASDLGVPVYGVGLLYQQGYFRQRIDADGHQEALYPYNDPTQLPISPLRDPNGEWLRISIHLPGIRL